MTDDRKGSRRGALKALVAVGGAAGCGAIGIPTVRLLVAPAHGGAAGGRWIRTVPLEALADGTPKRVSLVADHRDAWTLEKNVELGAAWLVRKGNSVQAWSAVCPHLGCSVDRGGSAAGFYCPCHDSSFDENGGRLSGPSPRGLDVLATRIDDGVVSVEFKRFRQGTSDKVAVG